MIDKFKQKLKKKGQSLTWFHRAYIKRYKRKKKLTYGAMTHQLNGYTTLSGRVKKAVEKYMAGK